MNELKLIKNEVLIKIYETDIGEKVVKVRKLYKVNRNE